MGPIYQSIQAFTAAADPAVVPINAPQRGRIRTFRVQITSATPGSFTYALYNSAAAFVTTAGVLTPTLATHAEIYRVTPDITVTGIAVNAGGFSLDYAYQNVDGTPNLRSSQLYMRITGAGAAATGNVILVVETPVMGM